MSRVFNSHIFLNSSFLVRTLLLHKYNKKNQKNFFIKFISFSRSFFKFDFLLLEPPHQTKKHHIDKNLQFFILHLLLILQKFYFFKMNILLFQHNYNICANMYIINRRSSQILFYFLFYCKL